MDQISWPAHHWAVPSRVVLFFLSMGLRGRFHHGSDNGDQSVGFGYFLFFFFSLSLSLSRPLNAFFDIALSTSGQEEDALCVQFISL